MKRSLTILNSGINNYFDIARRTQEGNVSTKKRDFEILPGKIYDILCRKSNVERIFIVRGTK